MLISKFSCENIEEAINNIESEYGITLPHQYKIFLHKYNGGYTPKTKFEIGKTASDVRGFYGFGDVELSINNVDIGAFIVAEFFPIAKDSFGNTILIGVGKKDYGKIFFCDHEQGNSIEYVTEDLKQFVDCCKSDRISESAKRSIKEREDILIAKGKGNVITDELRKMWQAEIDKYGSMVQEEVVIE